MVGPERNVKVALSNKKEAPIRRKRINGSFYARKDERNCCGILAAIK